MCENLGRLILWRKRLITLIIPSLRHFLKTFFIFAAKNLSVDNIIVVISSFLGISLFIGIVASATQNSSKGNVSVSCTDKEITVFAGDEFCAFKPEQFLGISRHSKKYGRYVHVYFGLLYEMPGSDILHSATLPNVPLKFVDEVAADISTRKFKSFTDKTTYKGTTLYPKEKMPTNLIPLMISLGIIDIILLTVFLVCKSTIGLTAGVRGLMGILFLFIIFTFSSILTYFIEPKSEKGEIIREITFEDDGIIINNTKHSYDNIDAITMVQPFIVSVTKKTRIIEIATKDISYKYMYGMCKREINPNEPYTGIYNRIINECFARKIQIK